MEDIEKIEETLKRVGYERMEKKYNDNGELCKAIFDARYGAEWDLSRKTEAEQRGHIINTLMYDDEKRLRYHVKTGFGLGVAFPLRRYSEEMLGYFFCFYLDYVLDEEKGLLCDEDGKTCPNQHIAQCIKKNIIKYGYENYYDYVIEYRNKILGKGDARNKFNDNQLWGGQFIWESIVRI